MTDHENWIELPLGQLLEMIRNGYAGRQVDHITEFPVSRIETISEAKINLQKVGYVQHIPDSYLIRPYDILFSNINSLKHIGKLSQLPSGILLYHGMNLLLLRPKKDVDPKFLLYKLTSEKPWFERIATQAINQASINQETLKQLNLQIPKDKNEQNKIAHILSTVDRAIEQTEVLIAKQQRIKSGLMQDLLARGIDEQGNLRSEKTHRFKDSPLGRIPMEWSIQKTGDLAQSLVPGRDKPYLDGGGIPWITIADLETLYVSGSKTDLSLSPHAIKAAHSRVMPKYTVLMSCVGEFGLASIATSRVVTNQQLHGFVCGQSIMPEWLVFQIITHRKQIELLATQTTIKYLNKSGCESIAIPIPNKEEQQRCVFVINRHLMLEQKNRNALKKLCSLKTALMQDLLTGRKRVTTLLHEKEMVNA